MFDDVNGALFSPEDFLVGDELRAYREKESYKKFLRRFIGGHRITDLFPSATSKPQFFTVLRALFLSHVFYGAWDEELFVGAVLCVLRTGGALSEQTLERHGASLKRSSGCCDI